LVAGKDSEYPTLGGFYHHPPVSRSFTLILTTVASISKGLQLTGVSPNRFVLFFLASKEYRAFFTIIFLRMALSAVDSLSGKRIVARENQPCPEQSGGF